jgi:16S rRNA (guanine527-N7)-methyltransferase
MSDSSPTVPALPHHLDQWQSALGWQPTESQLEQFQRLYDSILLGNQQQNLTRITEPDEFWEKHLWDSLSGTVPYLSESAAHRVIDIGTGAGFPGLPLAIARPDWELTLLDATRKKIDFVRSLLPNLSISNVQPMVGRAETVGQLPTHREQYSLVLLRAVAAPSVGAEYALPLAALGGRVVLYRGQWTSEDEQTLATAADNLGGAIASVNAFTTPLSHSTRHCIHLIKTKPTPPGYPRAIGIPKQHPLA